MSSALCNITSNVEEGIGTFAKECWPLKRTLSLSTPEQTKAAVEALIHALVEIYPMSLRVERNTDYPVAFSLKTWLHIEPVSPPSVLSNTWNNGATMSISASAPANFNTEVLSLAADAYLQTVIGG